MGQVGLSMNFAKRLAKTHETPETPFPERSQRETSSVWNSKTLPGLFVLRHRFAVHISLNELLDCHSPSQLLEAVMRQDFVFFWGNQMS